MKRSAFKTISLILPVVLNGLFCSLSSAQGYIYDFTTSIGNGSVSLNLNNLVYLFSANNGATYSDPVDTLAFNGTNYDHLQFSVYDNVHFFPNSYVDGFIIQAGSGGTTNFPDVSLMALGRPSLVTGTSPSDLSTILGSFGSFYNDGLVYPNPWFYYQQDATSPLIQGNLLSVTLDSTPEPATTSLSALGAVGFLMHRCRRAHARQSACMPASL